MSLDLHLLVIGATLYLSIRTPEAVFVIIDKLVVFARAFTSVGGFWTRLSFVANSVAASVLSNLLFHYKQFEDQNSAIKH